MPDLRGTLAHDVTLWSPADQLEAVAAQDIRWFVNARNTAVMPRLMTFAQAQTLALHGLWAITRYDGMEGEMLQGQPAGRRMGRQIMDNVRRDAQPAGSAVYITCLPFVRRNDWPLVVGFFEAVAQEIVDQGYLPGACADYGLLDYLFDQGAITHGWQRYDSNWPDGHLRAQVVDDGLGYAVAVDEIGTDGDPVQCAGMWRPGVIPSDVADTVIRLGTLLPGSGVPGLSEPMTAGHALASVARFVALIAQDDGRDPADTLLGRALMAYANAPKTVSCELGIKDIVGIVDGLIGKVGSDAFYAPTLDAWTAARERLLDTLRPLDAGVTLEFGRG